MIGALARGALDVLADVVERYDRNEVKCEKTPDVFVVVVATVATIWAVELSFVFGRRNATCTENDKEDHESTMH